MDLLLMGFSISVLRDLEAAILRGRGAKGKEMCQTEAVPACGALQGVVLDFEEEADAH